MWVMNYLLIQTNNWTYLLLVDLILAEALAGRHEISLFGGHSGAFNAGYNYTRQLYDTLTGPSVMQCNTTKVIRAFKCNMMATKKKKKKSISDLIFFLLFILFQMPTVII